MSKRGGLQSLEILMGKKSFLLPGLTGSIFSATKEGTGSVVDNPLTIEVTGAIPKSYRTEETVRQLKEILDSPNTMLLKVCYDDLGLVGELRSEIEAKITDSDLKSSIQSDGPNMVYYSITFKNVNYMERQIREKTFDGPCQWM